ncbi:hypothetical protein ASPWEDRAFT_134264 [Aspergillus wentii DTO 134E9]|uniref:Rhodopsin domain-containing protein n=1 Tax=Aspergillus wentii DTO 134E9 TaxID=1073089 RepID=A0A1L9RLV4_ASPWE|nr:uncharacterized protein ASPWEDRAFT_134264 [Aspergillus wentii DTO 134E9]KAI9929743.1 hypothetical protein MW887_001219 [Aspergillus wentii]OJJ35798.1 hypothetical protein ASPWEDRAFT_134264 [Aspergillus wentii DTO 134E9]
MPGGMHPPLEVIASWPPPNTVNPESHGPASIVLSALFGGIAVITILIRLWTRCVIQRAGDADDLLIALALIPILGLVIAIPLGAYTYGENHHTWDNNLTTLVNERKLAIASEVFYVVAAGLVKSSALLFYRRMGKRTIAPRFIAVIWISIVSVTAYSVAFLVVIFASCRPFHAFWMQVDPVWSRTAKWQCYDEGAHLIAASAISLVQDIIATILPAILCWNLQMPFRQRMALNAVFGLGFITAIIAGIRIYFICRLFYTSYDASWEVWYCWLFAMLEIVIAATCSSLPAVKVFLRWCQVPSILASYVRSIKYSHGSSGHKQSVVSQPHEPRCSGETDKFLLAQQAVSVTELTRFHTPTRIHPLAGDSE